MRMMSHTIGDPFWSIITLSFIFLSQASAAEYLDPIETDRILIDGQLNDWQHIRRYSAEHLLKGELAGMDDFQGGIRLAFNSKWLYLAFDCLDSEIIQDRQSGDHVILTLTGKNRAQRADFVFSFEPSKKTSQRITARATKKNSSSADQAQVEVTLNRKSIKAGEVKSIITPQQGYTIEAKVPMSLVPWVYGGEVKLVAVFKDSDESQGDSSYATHFTESDGSVSDVTYLFGGAHLYKELYRQQMNDERIILELTHQWYGDHRDEILLITESEIVLLGEGLSAEGGIVRYVHGWAKPEQIRSRIEGEGSASILVIDHLNGDGSLQKTEKFGFSGGNLRLNQ